jgi:hypothetical protein
MQSSPVQGQSRQPQAMICTSVAILLAFPRLLIVVVIFHGLPRIDGAQLLLSVSSL